MVRRMCCAPAARSSLSVPNPHSTPTVWAPAATPVRTSMVVSPIIRQSCGRTPMAAAANSRGSGCGFIRRVVCAPTTTAKCSRTP